VTAEELADAAQISSLSDETPEGRSIVVLAKEKYKIRAREVRQINATFIPFTAKSRMSGVDLKGDDGITHFIRKGSFEAIRTFVQNRNGYCTRKISDVVTEISRQGSTPLLVARDNRILGIIHLKDIVKGGIRQRFIELRKMGIRTIMITGDNPVTAAAIAAEAGV
jgi:K+-transporting ATPase ATPase B chain